MDNKHPHDLFKEAIAAEEDAYHFYRKAAEGSSSSETKLLFKKFAAVELSHAEELQNYYSRIQKPEEVHRESEEE